MITINEIRQANRTRDPRVIRAAHDRMADGIQGIDDEHTRVTLSLLAIEAALCGMGDPSFYQTLDLALDAAEKGGHPYDDPKWMAHAEIEATRAQRELDAIFAMQRSN